MRAAIFVALVIVITINLKIRWFYLLLVTLRRWWPLGFLVIIVIYGLVLSLVSLALGRMLSVEWSRFAISTGVIKFLSGSIIDSTRIIALDVLPRIAGFAINRVSIVVLIVANTLDCVRLLVYGLDNRKRIVRRDRSSSVEGGLNRRRDLRCDGEWSFCHNLAKPPDGCSSEETKGEFTES